MKQKGLFILGGAVAHYALMTAAIWASFGDTMARFDTGADETLREHVARWVGAVLSFPGYPIVDRFGVVYLGKWGDLIMAVSSVLWSVCFYWLVTMLLRRRARARAV